jgi:hypothetical protein
MLSLKIQRQLARRPSPAARPVRTCAAIAPAKADASLKLPLDPYRILQVAPTASTHTVKRSYQKLSTLKSAYYSEEAQQARASLLKKAADELLDDQQRQRHDVNLMKGGVPELTLHAGEARGGLCLLQESGESDAVIAIGSKLLAGSLTRPEREDIAVAMALAHMDLANAALSGGGKAGVVRGYEHLEDAVNVLGKVQAALELQDRASQMSEVRRRPAAGGRRLGWAGPAGPAGARRAGACSAAALHAGSPAGAPLTMPLRPRPARAGAHPLLPDGAGAGACLLRLPGRARARAVAAQVPAVGAAPGPRAAGAGAAGAAAPHPPLPHGGGAGARAGVPARAAAVQPRCCWPGGRHSSWRGAARCALVCPC